MPEVGTNAMYEYFVKLFIKLLIMTHYNLFYCKIPYSLFFTSEEKELFT